MGQVLSILEYLLYETSFLIYFSISNYIYLSFGHSNLHLFTAINLKRDVLPNKK